MTAVNLTKLNSEIHELIDVFTRPAEFHTRLNQLFGYYSVQVFRSGQMTRTSARLKQYHLPMLVLMQLERQLRRRCEENPQAAFKLYDELISDPYAEVSSLSASILGCIPAQDATQTLEHINQQGIQWDRDDRLLDYLQRSTQTIIPYAAQDWLQYLEETLSLASDRYHRFGLLLLQVSIFNDAFINLPFFFRHFLLFFPKANLRYRAEYLLIFEELYRRYPQESLHFFEQVLIMVDNEAIFRMFRKFLPTLDEPARSRFRELAKG
jgi:hypothetical protein